MHPQVFVMASGNLSYYTNLGNYTFALDSYSTTSLLGIPRQLDWDYYALSFHDYDHDGDLDALMTSFYKLSFFENVVSPLTQLAQLTSCFLTIPPPPQSLRCLSPESRI